jgi:hypothetical protein
MSQDKENKEVKAKEVKAKSADSVVAKTDEKKSSVTPKPAKPAKPEVTISSDVKAKEEEKVVPEPQVIAAPSAAKSPDAEVAQPEVKSPATQQKTEEDIALGVIQFENWMWNNRNASQEQILEAQKNFLG